MNNSSSRVERSIIKSAGGKSRQASMLLAMMPKKFNTYFEPFLGSGTMFLNVNPMNAVISDRNIRLINLMRCVKKNHALVADMLDAMVKSYLADSAAEKEKMYYEQRTKFNETLEFPTPDYEQAARYIFLNKTCFNGLFRENKAGMFNTPWGRDTCKPSCDHDRLAAVSKTLQNATIVNSGFSATLIAAQEGDFAFIDAVYDSIDSKAFTGYTRQGFSLKNLEDLREVCRNLDRRGVKWMMTNHSTPAVMTMFADYHIKEVQVKRNIAAKASARGMVTDVIITNYPVPVTKTEV